MQSKAATVKAYLAELPEERRRDIEAVRKVILANLDKDFAEGMQYGMIGYYVPHSVFAPGYHCDPRQPLPFAGLASQKNHMSLYMMSMYDGSGELAWFQGEWNKTGKRLDMGKCCIRFKKLDDLPLELIGEAFKRVKVPGYIAKYEASLTANEARKAAGKVGKPKGIASKKVAKKLAEKVAKGVAKKAVKRAAAKKKPSNRAARR